MAANSTYIASTSFSILGWSGGNRVRVRRVCCPISAQQTEVEQQQSEQQGQEQEQVKVKSSPTPQPKSQQPQINARSKNMSVEYGGQWLSSVTRHVRIYAAYIDPVTHAFDQTQMDKLTLILDPTNEFLWTPETCNKVYAYFQELVDHYEGAPLTEYTLRLIGSDIEHYIRKLLFDGEIRYNMNARVLNFSMGKPRVMFKNDENAGQEVIPK
ncbi:hypothetical protein Scep_002533 [Stephania cephalantha]|uniref:NAD(P)H-quinone oxidoreductase subunit M, chloroplastic n=1 Tax=Stephania cephalantha TaxID=152367 RepID=A0AAP0LE47_9MAGN